MTPEVKKRIEQIRQGIVPEGYKKTESGIIPNEWRVGQASKCIEEYKFFSNDISHIPVYSSSRKGLVPQSDYYNQREAVETNLGYKVVPQGYVTYRHMSDDDVFHFNINKTGENVLVSSEYPVFTSSDNCDLSFLISVLNNTARFRYFCKMQKLGGTRTRLYLDNLKRYALALPPFDEQKKIAEILSTQDKAIELQGRKIEELKRFKKGCLEKMFPRKGQKVPEKRFPGFTDNWEQRKFADVVQIERGGSPRPIDDYITDSPNGLNWVKIGDAPAQGHYITKTAEKIRPEGLSKTREVHPGDLILSNSMSFGKPYIMGIDGCIHDGWLLIRDTNNTFDLTFLCHLLGTPQMLDQYRSLAAGSTVNNLNKELVGNTVVTIPKIDEQRVLGQYLEQLDNLITLHQRKLEEMKRQKKALMQLLLTGIVRV